MQPFKIRVDGLKEAVSKFNRLPFLVKTALRLAMLNSVRDVQHEARNTHQFISRTGALEQSVETAVDYNNIKGYILLNNDRASYAPYVHNGAHYKGDIYPLNKKALRFKIDGHWVFAKRVHPKNRKGDPFLFKAAIAEDSKIQENFRMATAMALRK